MSGLAGLAVEKGHKVTGQDKAYYPPMSLQLNKIGISENITEKVTEDLKNCDAVIIGNSLSRGNDSVEYTLQNKKKYFSGPEWIRKYILDDKIVFVVTGTHGKTTTTSMLIKIFQDNKKLKLTEKEIQTILYLSKSTKPTTSDELQSKVWRYQNDLETHTVETHIYRLRKKFLNYFNDNNFIISEKNGYKIK